MRAFVFLLAWIAGASVCLAQGLDSPDLEVRKQAIKDLVSKGKTESWMEVFRAYQHQPSSIKVEILRVLPTFSKNYKALSEDLPEYKTYVARGLLLKQEIDSLMMQVGADNSKEMLDMLRAKISELQDRYQDLKDNPALEVVRPLTNQLGLVLSLGMHDNDAAIKVEAVKSLLAISESWFRPDKTVFVARHGNTDDFADFRSTMAESITQVVNDCVRRYPAVLLPTVLKKSADFPRTLVAFAQAKNSAIRGPILDLLDQKEAAEVDKGYACVVVWPFPEALPKLLRRVALNPGGVQWQALNFALEPFGKSVPRQLYSRWNKLSDESKVAMLVFLGDLPCQDSLRLIDRGIAEKDSEVRFEAVNALIRLLDVEWDEEYLGPDPKDFDEDARKAAKRTLARLANDSDRRIRQAVKEALEGDSEDR